MASCQLPIPVRAQTLHPSGRRVHWHSQAEKHGFRTFSIEPAVGPTELTQHVPAGVLRSLADTLAPAALKQAHKNLGIWATNRRFLASVAAGNATLFLEDDAILRPGMCGRTTEALHALQSSPRPSWDLLLLGHCGESRVPNCSRISSRTGKGLWLSRGIYPMCTHAYVASPRGASRLHGLLARWPHSYAEAVLRTARAGWELAGVSTKRRPAKRPVDDAHDVLVAKLVLAGQMDAYLMWPQAALQPWMLAPPTSIARGTADMALPLQCKLQSSRDDRCRHSLPGKPKKAALAAAMAQVKASTSRVSSVLQRLRDGRTIGSKVKVTQKKSAAGAARVQFYSSVDLPGATNARA